MIVLVVNLRTGDPWDVYCGRAGRGHDGYYGNPFKLTVDTRENRVEALQQFQAYFHSRLARDEEFKRRVEELPKYATGGVLKLACFCVPRLCHASIIAEYLEGFLERNGGT